MTAKYGKFFDNFKDIITDMVGLITTFTDTIKKFVEGFKKGLGAGDEFTY